MIPRSQFTRAILYKTSLLTPIVLPLLLLGSLILNSEASAGAQPAPVQTPAANDDDNEPSTHSSYREYTAQSGDTIQAVASHFRIAAESITSPEPLEEDGLLAPGQLLFIPVGGEPLQPGEKLVDIRGLMPDSEVIYGPSALDFDVNQYLMDAGGYLSTYSEYLGTTGWTSAADIISRIALENSVNPRLLLALLEYECGCVLGQQQGRLHEGYVLGVEEYQHRWLYRQLGWAVNELSKGYYGWRTGELSGISMPDGIILRPLPDSNSGSVSILYYFASLASQNALQKIPVMQRPLMDSIKVENDWQDAIDQKNGFVDLYERMFGNPWERANFSEPLFPEGTRQPKLDLPFEPEYVWSFTSGPHKAWQTEGANAALDFAPSSKHSGCVFSKALVTAAADGPVVRIGDGYIIQDLEGIDPEGFKIQSDYREQTGWALLYMHIQTEDKVPEGTYLMAGDPVGHPSCEGGPATGTHLHIARKFNGEWIPADGPLPFVLGGWRAHAGDEPYEGTLTKDDRTVIAHPWGSYDTLIWHSADIDLPVYASKPAKPESPNDKNDR